MQQSVSEFHLSTTLLLNTSFLMSSLLLLKMFLPALRSKRVYAAATWLDGWVDTWVSVTRRYCIKMAKPILKLFRPSGSHTILVSSDPCADTKFQREPLQ